MQNIPQRQFLGNEQSVILFPSHEQQASRDTGLEYQQQGYRSHLKVLTTKYLLSVLKLQVKKWDTGCNNLRMGNDTTYHCISSDALNNWRLETKQIWENCTDSFYYDVRFNINTRQYNKSSNKSLTVFLAICCIISLHGPILVYPLSPMTSVIHDHSHWHIIY